MHASTRLSTSVYATIAVPKSFYCRALIVHHVSRLVNTVPPLKACSVGRFRNRLEVTPKVSPSAVTTTSLLVIFVVTTHCGFSRTRNASTINRMASIHRTLTNVNDIPR